MALSPSSLLLITLEGLSMYPVKKEGEKMGGGTGASERDLAGRGEGPFRKTLPGEDLGEKVPRGGLGLY